MTTLRHYVDCTVFLATQSTEQAHHGYTSEMTRLESNHKAATIPI